MLSHIVRIAMRFEAEHGRQPTLLSLSPEHFTSLREQLGGQRGLDYFCSRLGMNIMLSDETVQPSVYAKTSNNPVNHPPIPAISLTPPDRI